MKDHFKTNGAFSWNELMTSDIIAAKTFYSELFGWRLEDMSIEEMGSLSYTVIRIDGEEIGGMMAIPPESKNMHPGWGTYVTVENADETAQKAKKLGANIIVPPTDIPGVGRHCMIQDPQGATISFITYFEKA